MKKKEDQEKALREFRIQDLLDDDNIISFIRKGTKYEPGEQIQMI